MDASALLSVFQHHLPPAPHHLPLLYNSPRRPAIYTRLVLSITPTPTVYSQLTADAAIFLHRPWSLDRGRLLPTSLVLASHQRLDELLTTGHNEPLMRRLGVVGPMERVVGYKDDPERKMGLVGLVDAGRTRREWAQLVRTEFGGLEREMGCEDGERHVMAIACMNAFEPRFLDRSVEAASELASLGTLRADCAVPEIQAADVLYITGESRSLGEKVARQLGMPVLFVGHRRCERWAIRYLAELARRDLPGMEVVVVDEEESVAKRARDCRV